MGEKAARDVVTRSPTRKVGRVNCCWFQASPVEHESQLEKKFILRAILWPHLMRIEHQPFRLKLEPPDSWYTPDYRLTFRNGQRVVVEVKPQSKIKQIIPRLDSIARTLARDGIDFLVVHEGQIQGGDRLERAQIVRRYATTFVPDAMRSSAIAAVAATAPLTVAQLKATTGISLAQLCALVARHQIALGFDLGLSDADPVLSIPSEPQDAAAQFGIWFGAAPWRKDH